MTPAAFDRAPRSPSEARWRRRAQIAPGAEAGVSEAMIAGLVARFYERVRADDLLGPIFEARVHDWPAHVAKLSAFWSSVTLMSGRFKGSPMAAHLAIPGLEPAHFDRWLGLWRDTARACCPPAAAQLFSAKAEMIAQSLSLGAAAHQGRLPAATALPPDVQLYGRTPTFTEATTPAGLQQAHSTAPGVWGRIVVEAGALRYRITDPARVPVETVLRPDEPGVVEPTIRHEVAPQGPVRFHVEFHRHR